MSLKLSRECVVHSVICVLFIVIAVKDVIPRRPRHFTEKNIERKKTNNYERFHYLLF